MKKNWRRMAAGTLAAAIAAGTIDISQFGFLQTYAYSKDYGICVDNHNYSDTGANCATDQYACTTISTKEMTHGSEEWRAAIEHNKQILLSKIGNGDERTVMKTAWAAIAAISSAPIGTGGMMKEDVDEAKFWVNEIKKNVDDSIIHQYWDNIPIEFTHSITEEELGIVRHGAAGEMIIQRDKLLAALCEYDLLFPGKGENFSNAPGSKYRDGAHWLMPRMGTGWRESYDVASNGEGGVSQWPADMASHTVTVGDGDAVTEEMVRNAALSLQGNAYYLGTGKMDAQGNVIKDSIGTPGSRGREEDEDEEEDGGVSVSAADSNTYYINMSRNFHGNAGVLKIWNNQTGGWQTITVMDKSPTQINGWTIQIEPSHMTTMSCAYAKLTYNGTGTAPELLGYFEIPKGSFVSVEDTTWDSPLDFAADIMEVYECVACPSGRRPVEKHQHFIKIHSLKTTNTYPCFKLGATTDPIYAEGAEGNFRVYRHEEDWQTDYNVQLDKMDYETGKPVQGAVFALYEKFEDQEEVDESGDGSVTLYEGSDSGDYPGSEWQSGYTSSPVLWNNFRKVSSYTTDANGHIEADVAKKYHYEKTYCDGHSAPTFVPVPELPELEVDEETGEDNSDEVDAAQAEIDAAQEQNRAMAEYWCSCFDACANTATEREGVHFHWLGDGVKEDTIREIASSGGAEGSTPDGGTTGSFSMETAYEKSGCKKDTEETYEKLIALKYSYTWKESKARDGYILHGTHNDDVRIEVITTDSSQNGANAQFSNEKYSDSITINGRAGTADVKNAETKEPVTLIRLLSSALLKQTEKEEVSEKIPEKETLEPFIRKDFDFGKTGFTTLNTTSPETIKFRIPSEKKKTLATKSDADETLSNAEETPSNAAAVSSSTNAEEPEKTEKKRYSLRTFIGISDPAKHSPAKETAKETSEEAAKEAAKEKNRGRSSSSGFESAFQNAFTGSSTDSFRVRTGPDSKYSHCNDTDGEGDSWRVYDHRTEGEIHFNKRDLDLSNDVSESFSDYAQTNGDGTLEGAVYGLFADEDIIHPDGKTGAVYKEGNLVAIATTDPNGDGSFLAFTEAPGVVYDYEKGTTVKTDWYTKAPKNRYRNAAKAIERENDSVVNPLGDTGWTVDDYTIDKNKSGMQARTERRYDANEENNGNCWIGRPLILGKYYIKELSRSEGYELSINGKANTYTNHDPENPEADFEGNRKDEEEKGSVTVSKNLYINGQESIGAENEPFFRVSSSGTTQNHG